MVGKIDISALNTPPEKNELETAKYFASMGKDMLIVCEVGSQALHVAVISMVCCPPAKLWGIMR